MSYRNIIIRGIFLCSRSLQLEARQFEAEAFCESMVLSDNLMAHVQQLIGHLIHFTVQAYEYCKYSALPTVRRF